MVQKDRTKEELIEEMGVLQKRITEIETLHSEHKQQWTGRRRFETVVRDSNDAIIIHDIDGRITAWNRGAEQMYGYNEKEVLGMDIECLTVPGKTTEYRDFTSRLIAGETTSSFETQRLTKDGRILDVWLTVTKLMEDPEDSVISTGRDITMPIGIASIERNISERKKAEGSLAFNNIILRTQQELSIDGILVVDENGKMLSFNQRFINMWGITRDVIESKSDERALQSVVDKLANPEEFTRKIKHLYEVRDEICKDEVFLKDGRIFDRYSAPMFSADKTYYGRVWYFRDITERKTMEEAVQKHLNELEIFYKASIGREERIIELKKKVAELEKKLGI